MELIEELRKIRNESSKIDKIYEAITIELQNKAKDGRDDGSYGFNHVFKYDDKTNLYIDLFTKHSRGLTFQGKRIVNFLESNGLQVEVDYDNSHIYYSFAEN